MIKFIIFLKNTFFTALLCSIIYGLFQINILNIKFSIIKFDVINTYEPLVNDDECKIKIITCLWSDK
jgi:hypothetical protein